MSSCPLQAVLLVQIIFNLNLANPAVIITYEFILMHLFQDFEDASSNTDDKDAKRELMLVADALRLGGAILALFPNMLAPQLIGRVNLVFCTRSQLSHN